MAEGYRLVVQFTDPSPSFVHGFEAGRLWQRMGGAERVIEETVHQENTELIVGMAMTRGFAETFTPLPGSDGGWTTVKLVNITALDAAAHRGAYYWIQRGGSEHVEMVLVRGGVWFAAGESQQLDPDLDLRVLGPAEPPELDGAMGGGG